MELAFKATHVVGFILWIAGLIFYSRLLVAFRQSGTLGENDGHIVQKQLEKLLNQVYNLIANPGLLLVLIGGIAMIANNMGFLKMGWMHPKLLLVILLIGYQHMSKSIFKKLRSGQSNWTVKKLKNWSIVPILLMLGIVILATFKFF